MLFYLCGFYAHRVILNKGIVHGFIWIPNLAKSLKQIIKGQKSCKSNIIQAHGNPVQEWQQRATSVLQPKKTW